MKSSTEVEVKIRLEDRTETLHRLQNLGFENSAERQFEANTLFDTQDQSLRQQGTLLRLRESGGKFVITWKGKGEPGPHKSREELETTLGSLETLAKILDRLGYRPTFRYEKYRAEFERSQDAEGGVVTLDETPVGDFMEIEGPAAWIESTARNLGFAPGDYVLESYGQIYLDHCRRHGVEPENMVFSSTHK